MPPCADLEISLRRRDEDSYELDLRFSQPESDADVRLGKEVPAVKLDVKALRKHHLNDVDYGQTLAAQLFAHPRALEAFNLARSHARSQDLPLRLRLFLDPGAVELHSLHWERLRDPDNAASPLLTGEHYYFSRYLSSFDWQPVRPRAKSELKALVVIANPADLDPEHMAPVDVVGELARAKAGLGEIETTVLARAGEDEARPTLQQIQDHLRQGYDILYLVCHGALEENEPRLWLEKDNGMADVVPGRKLVTRLEELQQRPRLVVLASCQSAGRGDQRASRDEGALAALGPRLAEIGIPAVLAMQGNISMITVEQFMPRFFAELQVDGQIDRAMAIARGAVRERPDWWMPVLFMRLKSGQLWYTPGFAGGDDKLADKWEGVLSSIFEEECTPILGPSLTEPLFGERQELAHQLAEDYRFPLASHARDDLPQVGQYIAVSRRTTRLLPREFMNRLFQECSQRYAGILPDGLRRLAGQRLNEKKLIQALNELTQVAGQYRREQPDLIDAYHDLARLPFPIYITTDPTNLLVDALAATGKQPRRELCHWHSERFKEIPSIYEKEPKYIPHIDRPLVYHLFGHIDWPATLVLTEDDYFDYLIGLTSHTDLIPKDVRAALVNKALLFLGFKMDDWNFRVLFRSIMNREGSALLEDYPHIAVQITPDEERVLMPEGARRYLETYFQRNREIAISIYWGSSQDFMAELHAKWDWEKKAPK